MSDITHINSQSYTTHEDKKHHYTNVTHYFVELINCLSLQKLNKNSDHLPNIALLFPFRSIHTNLLSQDVSPVPWFT